MRVKRRIRRIINDAWGNIPNANQNDIHAKRNFSLKKIE